MTGALVGLTDRPESSLTAHPEAPEAAGWWDTLRTVAVTAAEIALKVLPVLLAAATQQARGEDPGDDQVVLSTGPLAWEANPRSLSVSVTNTDPLKRPVTVVLSPDPETGDAAVTFVVAAGTTQVVAQDVWARIAKGQDGSLVSISVPPAASVGDEPSGGNLTTWFKVAVGAWSVGQILRYAIPGERNGWFTFEFRSRPTFGIAWGHNNRRDTQVDIRVRTGAGDVEVTSPPPRQVTDGGGELFLPFPPGFVATGEEGLLSGWIEVLGPPLSA